MRTGDAFAVFDAQDSGCRSYGIERAGRRWFVKTALSPHAAAAMTRVVALHRAVRHEAVVRPVAVQLGRTLQHLLTDDRGTDRERAVAARATDADPARRHPTVAALAADWRS